MIVSWRGILKFIIVYTLLGEINSSILRNRRNHVWKRQALTRKHTRRCAELELTLPLSNNNSSSNATITVKCEDAKEGETCFSPCFAKEGIKCVRVWDRSIGMHESKWIGKIIPCRAPTEKPRKLKKLGLTKDIVKAYKITEENENDFKVYKLAQQSQKTCDALQIDSTRGVTGSCPSGPIDSVCFFTCRPNFYPTTGNGQFKLTCTDDAKEALGYWAGAIPNCKRVLCPTINAPAGGVLSGICAQAPADSICILQCTGNTRPVGVTSVKCIADPGSRVGRWDSPLGICQSINCPNLQYPPDGSSSGQCTAATPGAVCDFACRAGFTLVGSNRLQCLDTGTWNTNVPICRVNNCPNLGNPDNGAASGTCSNAIPGNKCSFQCNPGFQLNGISDLTCQNDGQWTGPTPFCSQIFCQDLIAPYQGSTDGNCIKATPGQLCNFYCAYGYRLTGSPVLTCNETGKWSGPPPTCERIICPPLTSAVGGRLSGKCSDASPNDVCQYSCLPGYKPSPIQSITCQSDGTWSAMPPPCEELICPNVLPPEGGAINGRCVNATYGAVCNFTCNSGFRLLGADSITCQNSGLWTGNPPICQRITCPNLYAPSQGSTSGTCVNAGSGSTCEFACSPGYVLAGNAVLTCNPDGTWNYKTPTCVQVICPPIIPTSGSVISGSCNNAAPNQICYYSCLNGYRATGPNNAICQNDGTWSAGPPVCEQIFCPDLQALTDGQSSGVCLQATYGAMCNFTCNPGFRLNGVQSIVCQNDGAWTGTVPVCQRITCPNLYAPSQGTAGDNCINATPGGICQFACDPGYKLVGSPSLTCTDNGTWNGVTPTCARNTCPVLAAPENGAVTGSCTNANPDQYCYFSCGIGYKLLGPTSSLCQINGAWTNQPPTCQKILCPNLEAPQYGSVTGNCEMAELNQVCNYNCNEGYRLEGQNPLKCQSSGTWTSPPPVCQPNLCPDQLAPINGGTTGACSQSPIGSQCQFFCNKGYVLNGKSPLVCTGPDGVWDGPTPICSRVMCPNLAPPPGGSLSGTCSNAAPSNLCAFYCSNGFRLVGSNVTTCQDDGTWTNPVPECQKVVCTPDLVSPQGGSVSGNCVSATTGDQCNFTCGVGYRLLGVNRLTCQNDGQWTGVPPMCEPILCTNLVAPVEGAISGNCISSPPGSVCTFSCNPGFSLNGSPQLICMNTGNWNAPTPFCTRVICPTLSPPAGGSSSGRCSNASPKDVCQFYCPVGQTLIGSPSSNCLDDGTWSSPTPACQRNVCPPLDPPVNGAATGTCSNAYYNDGCQFNCSVGYRLTGSSWISCLANGSWALPIATCERITCQSLSTPPNAQASGVCVNAGVGQQCTFTCNPGYIPANPFTLLCTETGAWNGQQPICSRIQCSNLVQPQNGILTGTCSSATPGQRCQFSCVDGYRLVGSAISNCKEDGSWSDPVPTCQRIICPDLQPPVNGNQLGQCSNANPGGICQFSCQDGYILIGSQSSTCQNDGTYSNPAPICQQILCPTLPPPVNGNSAGMCSNATPGQICQFSCQPGYRLLGSPQSNCQPTGAWTSPTPTCQKITCPDLTLPVNGNQAGICAGASPTDVCQFSCQPGYYVSGSPSVTCQADGTWSNQPPTCAQILCPILSPPVNGNSAGTCANATPNQVCQFSCQPGYQLIGTATSNCQITGAWSSPTPTCQKITCPDLTPPVNGNQVGVCTGAVPTEVCQFSCQPGYNLNGSPSATCQPDGTWSNQPPTCSQILCPTLNPPVNGNSAGTCANATPGQVCQFSCQPGYLLIGNASSNCQINGGWSSPTPTCQKIICPNLSPPVNGNQVGMCTGAVPAEVCQFSCQPGYKINGNPSATCQPDGTWSNQPPTCAQIICPTLNPPVNGNNAGTCANATPSQVCQFSCQPGYNLNGSPTATCQLDGTWSNQPPTCAQIICPTLNPPVNGNSAGTCANATPSQICQFSCQPGYNLNGNPSATCQLDGTWSNQPPTCAQIICPTLNPPVNGNNAGTCANATPSQVCEFFCQPGYTLTGNPSATCQADGSWSNQPPTCQQILCPNVQALVNGVNSGACQNAPVGSQCSFSCNNGFQLIGSQQISCQNDGTWTGAPPVCQQIMCPEISLPANSVSSGICTQAISGSQCSFTCNKGYSLNGPPQITCQVTGQWDAAPPVCVQIVCPSLVPPISGSLSGVCQNANPDAQCLFACNTGFRLSGTNPLLCQNDGTWNSNPPTCTEIVCPNLQPNVNSRITGKCQQAVPTDTCTFSCNQGFLATGNTNFVCQTDGTWSPNGNPPTCTLITCPTLNNPENGAATGVCASAIANSACRFQCNAGFQITGSSSLLCSENGAWSGPPPICERVRCPDLVAPKDGLSTGVCKQASSGGSCTFSCNPGYYVFGQAILTCTDRGNWDNQTPICLPIPCLDLQTPQNGVANGVCKNAKAYDQCTFTCAEGYNLIGVSTLTCQIDSKWTGLAPRCIRITCPDLSPPQYGTNSGSCVQASQGSVCTYACNNGYVLQGSASLTCQPTGQWNGNPPSCRLLQCPDLRAPIEGRIQGICTQASPGAVCSFSCNPCYRLRGDSTLTCSGDGLWSGNAPICEVITCPNLVPPQSATFSGVCTQASPGNICRITCSAATRIKGPNSITCQANGTWSDQLPTCGAITCPDLVVPSGGQQSGVCVQAPPGSICTFSCDPGNSIMGSNSLSCGPDGKWSGQPPTCTTVMCPEIRPPQNGQTTGTCRNAVSGNTCSVTCIPGYNVNGSPVLTCRPDGTWDINPPTCNVLNCPLLSASAGGTTSGICSLATSGNKCNFACDPGYQLQGVSSLTCLPTGQWDQPSPQCLGNTCPDLFAPTGGRLSGTCTKALVGSTCSFQCNGELVLSGSSTLTCQSNGGWNADLPSCFATPRCPDLLPPAGGSVNGQCSSVAPNSICTFTCTEGRELRGFNQLTCRSDGTWSSEPPVCQAPQCPALPTPANGFASGSCMGASAGQSCQFSCNGGYVLNGNALLTCLAPGRWDNAAPTCQLPGVNCPKIDVANGVENGACANAEPGRVCLIGCIEGFRISGASKLICLADGTWDNAVPVCTAVTCPAIASPQNGAATGTCANAMFNQVCEFKCNAGFTIEGASSITCQADGNWNETPPSCPQTTCAELANPPFGAISGTCASAVGGDKCQFSCENGFKLIGSTTLTCRPDGNWDTSPPTCNRIVCPRKTAITNGAIKGICQDAVVEQICSFECNPGYNLLGSKELTCTPAGNWNADSPTCVLIKCPDLFTPNNGRMSGTCTDASPNVECNFACNNDYNLVGTPKLTCQGDGTWNAAAPTCEVQVKCPNLQDPAGGNSRGACTRADPGKTCLFTCDAGFKIDGEETLTCQDSGQWSAPPPKCQQLRCPALNRPENGQTSGTCTNRAVYGDECRFTCSSGYRLVGRSSSRCKLTGEWTEPVPTCEPISCGPIVIPQNGKGTDGCTTGIYNERCIINCNEGYRLIGTASLTCLAEGYWSYNVPTCEIQSCRSLTVPTNGRMTGRCSPGNAFMDCEFECNAGYRLNNKDAKIITCQANGQWNGKEPTCLQIQCPALQPVLNSATSGQCSPGLPGASCRFTCKRGFKLQGPPSITCTAEGSWDTQPPICNPLACPDLAPPAQGSMAGACTGATLDSKCTFKCNAGYTLEGRAVLNCQADEQWDELIPSCQLNTCDDLNAPDDGAMTGDCAPGVPTKTCTFTCSDNYKLVGRPILTCKNNGQWNYKPPVCSQVKCPGLKAPGNGSMDGVCEPNGIAPDTCSFLCAPGFNLVGTETLTCQATGRWDARPPRCVAITCPNKFPPQGASISGQCTRATPGQRCVFICIDLNTRLVGNDMLICNDDGTWSSESPVCEGIQCPDIGEVESLVVSGVCKSARPNDVCRFTCSPGTYLEGTSSITCNRDGTWSGNKPICTKVICPPLTAPTNGKLAGDCAPGIPTQTCTVTCNDGLNPASAIYTCQQNGKWNPVPPNPLTCTASPSPVTQTPVNPNPICSRLIRPPNGRIDRCDLYEGGKCIFTCNNGYVIYGGPVRTCQPNGRWDGLAPTCIKRTVVIPNGAYQQQRRNN